MKIRVPASSGNIGPGFDCFGIAWKLYDVIEFLPRDNDFEINGCPAKYRGSDNLCLLGYKAALKAANLPEKPVAVNFLKTEIPISRGLGSSAALIVAGAAAANEICGCNFTKEELLAAASEAEGHPDNAAPSLFGGFTASVLEGGRAFCAQLSLSKNLYFTALIPDFEISTKLARSVLPGKFPREDAVFNISRAALLIKAAESGDVSLLSAALKDRIHQPYRTRLIENYDAVREIALNSGAAGVCISGAGPTLLCISGCVSFSEKIRLNLAKNFPNWRVLPLIPDYDGTVIAF